MARRETVRPQFARHVEQIGEFGPHVAPDAGHRRASGEVIVREGFDHVFAKGAFVIMHVMRDT